MSPLFNEQYSKVNAFPDANVSQLTTIAIYVAVLVFTAVASNPLKVNSVAVVVAVKVAFPILLLGTAVQLLAVVTTGPVAILATTDANVGVKIDGSVVAVQYKSTRILSEVAVVDAFSATAILLCNNSKATFVGIY